MKSVIISVNHMTWWHKVLIYKVLLIKSKKMADKISYSPLKKEEKEKSPVPVECHHVK